LKRRPARKRGREAKATHSDGIVEILTEEDSLSLYHRKLDQVVDIFQRIVEDCLRHRLVFFRSQTLGDGVGAKLAADELGDGYN
jgi:hypothetical protein